MDVDVCPHSVPDSTVVWKACVITVNGITES